MTKWQYEASDDVYRQMGLAYAANPADSSYETMGVFVPGAYFTATDNGAGSGAHFDAILAELVSGSDYAQAFVDDLARTDALGNTVDVRVNMYNPMYYLSPACEGYGTSEPATFWRIRTGINQGDTALCTEIDLALAAAAYSDETQVDFETVWGHGHTMDERTGASTDNFIAWVHECIQ